MKNFTLFVVLTIFALAACGAPATPAPEPTLPAPTSTLVPPPTETPTPTLTETPDFSDITDARLESDGLDAIKAATTLISSMPNASDEEITEALLRKWLEYYKTDAVNEYLRLKDYKIEKVTANGGCPPPDKDTSISLAWVDFSVQPVYAYSGDWIAATGESTPGNNWIYHKVGYVSVSASKGFYTLGFEGIPPCAK